MSRRTYLGFEPQKNTRGTTDVETARAIFLAEGKIRDIALRFKVSYQIVYDIKAGRTWGYATGLDGRTVRTGSAGRYDDPVRGTVILYSQNGGKVAERRYVSHGGRLRVLQSLKESLGAERFARLVVAFRPELREASVAAVSLDHPEAVTFGLKAQKIRTTEITEVGEEPWEALKRQLGIGNGEKCDEGVEEWASNGPERDSFTPSFDDLPPGVGLDRVAQIDAKIEEISQVA